MGFGGGRKAAPEPKPEPEVKPVAEKQDKTASRQAEQEAAALRARKRRGGMRSLLSPAREEAQTGLSNKLGG